MSAPTNNDSIDFEKLVEDHYASLYRFAYSLSGKEADAWDLTQQTFSRWAEKGDSLRDKSKAKSWLFTTLYREFLRWKRQSKKVFSMEDVAPASEGPAVPADVVDRADAASLMEILSDIDDTYRTPLSLFYLEDMTYREIAEVLEIPAGTVMSRLSRGKDQLRQRLSSANQSVGNGDKSSRQRPGSSKSSENEQG
jgi:RNA polymerase sigma factor (sigma-70 family)